MMNKIVSSKILIEWNDNPKMEVVLNDMPDGLRQDFDDWLSTIEDERNEGGILQDRDQQAEDDYWDNHPEEAKRPPIDENLEEVILGAFKKVFPERFTPTDTSDVDVVSEDLMWVGFKDYDIRVEKDPEFNDGHLQISVHSKKDDGYMLHQDGEPCKLIVREENENE